MNVIAGDPWLQALLEQSFREDAPQGDVTTEALGLPESPISGWLIAKQEGVFSGAFWFEAVFRYLWSSVEIHWFVQDGEGILPGQRLARVVAPAGVLLKGERVALNGLMRLGGIATLTHRFVQQLRGTTIQLLDTRKTLPGWRLWEKKAVRDGGGVNHRLNLSEAILIKDNHIQLVGGVGEAIRRVKQRTRQPITVEVKTLKELEIALQEEVDQVLLDHWDWSLLKEIVPQIKNRVKVELSGNITGESLELIKQIEPHFVSVGAITHSAPALDLSFKIFEVLKNL